MRNNFLRIVGVLFSVALVAAFVGCPTETPRSEEQWGSVYEYPKLTDADFLEKTRTGVVLIDFDADWCGWCRKMDPHLAKLHDRYGDKLTIAKIDFDRNPEASRHFGVQGIPALFLLVDGKLTRQALGYQDENQLVKLVDDIVAGRQSSEGESPSASVD